MFFTAIFASSQEEEAPPGAEEATAEAEASVVEEAVSAASTVPAAPAPAISAQKEESGGFKVTISTIADAVFLRTVSGQYAEQNVSNYYRYQGEGDLKFFSTSLFDDPVNGNVRFEYANNLLGGLLVFKGNKDTWYDNSNWDWQAYIRLFGEHLRLLSGNQARYSEVAYYQNFDDFLKTKIDALGVFYPTWMWVSSSTVDAGNVRPAYEFPYGYNTSGRANKGYASFSSTAVDDLFMPAGSLKRQERGFLIDGKFSPVTISASVGGLFEKSSLPFTDYWYVYNSDKEATRIGTQDETYAPLEEEAINAGFRAEASDLGGFLDLSAVYKYAYQRITKDEADYTNDENRIDAEIGNHAFGLFANINLDRAVRGLSFTLGASGLYQTWSNEYKTSIPLGEAQEAQRLSANLDVKFPVYMGADLRVQYAGVPRLRLTLNNNVSFASNESDGNYADRYTVGWAYDSELNSSDWTGAAPDGWKESYMGLYNALGLRYALTDKANLDFQAANQLGIFTLDFTRDPVKSVTEVLGLYAGGSYSITLGKVKGTVRGGLAAKVSSFSYQDTSREAKVSEAGYIDFGIPLELRVEF